MEFLHVPGTLPVGDTLVKKVKVPSSSSPEPIHPSLFSYPCLTNLHLFFVFFHLLNFLFSWKSIIFKQTLTAHSVCARERTR